jgi:hypothetical protein
MANIKIPQLGSAQIINDTNYLIVDDGLNTMKATAKQIKEYATNDVKAEIAENWTENVNYTVGNVVNWNGAIYRCKQNNLSSESLTPANATYWENKTIGDMIYSLTPYVKDTGYIMVNSNLNGNIVSGGNAFYRVIGRTCYVSINGVEFLSSGSGLTVLNNLPKAGAFYAGFVVQNGLLTDGSVCFIDPGSTSLKAHIGTTTGLRWMSLIYTLGNDAEI